MKNAASKKSLPAHPAVFCAGEPSRTINVTAAGTYSVTVSDANNCTGTGSATVSILPVPALSAGND
ncbi:MAG TPA: hypothetical protein VNJ07_01230, partial [Chitinophagales bacterium]|nr:hypothetical protein [Chitinophagales bacterium]